jgi:hypothetical protein
VSFVGTGIDRRGGKLEWITRPLFEENTQDLRLVVRFFGTFFSFLRAFERPMAIACLRLLTFLFGKRDGLAMAKKSFDVVFVATYDDGRSELFNIDRFTLRSGDQVAKIIAGERQSGGQLPAGKIASVKRLEG